MHEKRESPDPGDEPPLDYAWAVLISVGLVLAGLFVGLPWLLSRTPVSAWTPVVLLIVPLFPTVTGWLQGETTCRLPGDGPARLLLREYLFHLWNLSLELTLLLAGLPLIAARLGIVLGCIMFVAFAIASLLGVAQQLTGWQPEGMIAFTWADIWSYTQVALASLGGTAVAAGLGVVLDCFFDRSTQMAAGINRRVLRWLRDHV